MPGATKPDGSPNQFHLPVFHGDSLADATVSPQDHEREKDKGLATQELCRDPPDWAVFLGDSWDEITLRPQAQEIERDRRNPTHKPCKEVSAAQHTYDVGYQKWAKYDANAEVCDNDTKGAPNKAVHPCDRHHENSVQDVLRAKDLYATISASFYAPTASRGAPQQVGQRYVELCRCYVRTAMRVHPLANARPDAPEAFRRAAAAWKVLRDDQALWRYDQELQAGRGLLSKDDKELNCHYSLPPMSADEAETAFASAVRLCSSGSSTGDFKEVLRCAEALLEQSKPEGPDSVSTTARSCGYGVAMSAGLFLAGAAADSAGYGVIAQGLRKGALYQGVSQVAMGGMTAYQNNTDARQTIADAAKKISLLTGTPPCASFHRMPSGTGGGHRSSAF